MPFTVTVEFEDDDIAWLTEGTRVMLVEKKEWQRIQARSLRNFQLYLDATDAAMKERWRLEDEIARLKK